MKRDHVWFWVTCLFAASALVASAILLVDYMKPMPVFCDASGGCAKMKATAFARPLGIPTPAIGILGLLGVAFAALVPGPNARRFHAALGVGGGLIAIFFFGVQAKMGALCPYCAVVDSSAIVLMAASVYRLRKAADPPAPRVVTFGAVAGFLAAIGVPLVIGGGKKPVVPISKDVPMAIAEEIQRTGKGRVTVVDFVDFECPFCRMTHAELKPLLDERQEKVRVVRKHVPLRMHEHALDAARAGCCAEQLGKGDEMADLLFSADPKELTGAGCESLAAKLGLDLERFRACVRDPATEARIDQDRDVFRSTAGHGLPTIWVGETKFEGAQDRETLRESLDAAIRSL